MSIRVLCERCGKSYDFKSEHIGKRFRCKICDKVLEVRDMISEFENIESQSSEVFPQEVATEPAPQKSKSIIEEKDDDEEVDHPPEVEVTKRKKNKSRSKKKDEKEPEGWQQRLEVKNNTYESPAQVIMRLIIQNIYMVIFVILGMIGAFALLIFLLIP